MDTEGERDETLQNHWGVEGERDETLQNHWDAEGVGDMGASTTTDHIIYFGIQAQTEGYVAERTSTRRVKNPNGPNGSGTDEAPYSEDLTQGGEMLPAVRREHSDNSYEHNNSNGNCYHTASGGKKGKTRNNMHADNQYFTKQCDC